ncbi:hypothetical protein QFC24_002792 [Naganishia onofrii]|uniref:Uncharacterized protein n=1 Tax=Naganishia onofrii TaxID=1851511 RepID=A0ACC2XML2_9TREE|nr:hypothetical protein QFC24_002792 [Naganishia onofrii]
MGDRIAEETLGEGSRSRTQPNDASMHGGGSPPRKRVRRSPSYEPYQRSEATARRPSDNIGSASTHKMPPRDPAYDRDKRHMLENSRPSVRDNRSGFASRYSNDGQSRDNANNGRFNKWDHGSSRDHKDLRPDSTKSYIGGFPRKSLADQSDVFSRSGSGNGFKRQANPASTQKRLPTSPAASKKNRRDSRSRSPERPRERLHTSQRTSGEPSRSSRRQEERDPLITASSRPQRGRTSPPRGQDLPADKGSRASHPAALSGKVPTSPSVRSTASRNPGALSQSRPAPVKIALPSAESKQVPLGPASSRIRPKPISISPNVANRNPPLHQQPFPARSVPSGPRAMSSPHRGTPGTPNDSDLAALENLQSSLRLQHEIYDGMRNAASGEVRQVLLDLIQSDPEFNSDDEAFWRRNLKKQPSEDQLTNLRVLQGQHMIISGLERQEKELQTRLSNAASAATQGEKYQTGSISRQQERAHELSSKSETRMHPLRNDTKATIEDPQRPHHQTRREHDIARRQPEDERTSVELQTKAIAGNQTQEQSSSGRSEKKKSEEKRRPAEKKKPVPYEKIAQVGEGTYGKVYKARNGDGTGLVALKRIRMEGEKDGFPVTAMREIKLLQSLDQGNIVKLYEMMISHGSVHMVMEYMDHDLSGILSQPQITLSVANLKSFCQQMLRGLAYLHRKAILHRDMKGSNILINSRGELKLADFGLARHFTKRKRNDYTNRVVTLWYRSPELLLGETMYDVCIDNWSAGCIMLELFVRKPVFQGNDEIHQLEVIYEIMGTPTEEEWPGLANMPWYELVKPKEVLPSRFEEYFAKRLNTAGTELAKGLLHYDPAKRLTADQALESTFFSTEEPAPEIPSHIASIVGEWHEMEAKHERARRKQRQT